MRGGFWYWRGVFPALARRLLVARRFLVLARRVFGSSAETSRCAERFRLWRGVFPAPLRRVVAARSLPASGAESCRCAERCPLIGRSTLRAARSLLGNDGRRSAIMAQATDNAPRSCSGAATLRDHAPARERFAVMPQNGTHREHRPGNPCRQNRARPVPQEPHRVTLQGPRFGGRSPLSLSLSGDSGSWRVRLLAGSAGGFLLRFLK